MTSHKNRDAIVLNKDSDNQLECAGYQDSACMKIIFYILVVMTLGLLLVIVYWKPEWKVHLTKLRTNLGQADAVILKDQFGKLYPEVVKVVEISAGLTGDGFLGTEGAVRYFQHKYIRYVWDNQAQGFTPLRGLQDSYTCAQIHKFAHGLGEADHAYKLQLYGENSVQIEVKSYVRLFFEEVLKPITVYAILVIIFWCIDNYYIYASWICLTSPIVFCIELYQSRRKSEILRDVVSTEETVQVVRKGRGVNEVPAKCLVPGDVIIIPARGCIMPCDVALISGNALVNESILTGESVPVIKTPLVQSEEIYSPKTHKCHTLYSGTRVIQTRYYVNQNVMAVVIRTGVSTVRGELVRSILFPKPIGLKFYKDAMKFLFIMALIAFCGMVFIAIPYIMEGATAKTIIMRTLDFITIMIPPALLYGPNVAKFP